MSFEDYFRLEGHDVIEQYARFIAGLSPAMLQRTILQWPSQSTSSSAAARQR